MGGYFILYDNNLNEAQQLDHYLFNLLRRSVTDEQRLSTPFKGDTFTRWNGVQINFSLSYSQDICTCTHCAQKVRCLQNDRYGEGQISKVMNFEFC